MAIRTFADQLTADVAAGLNTKHSRKLPQRVWSAAQRRLDALNAARSLNDLKGESFKLHELSRDRLGYYAIKVNDQYRIVFRFVDGDAFDAEVTDYHP
jgi:toxin HigB-1